MVNEATGAVVAGATVTLTGGTGTTRSAVTDATGKLSFTALAPGSYTLSIGGVKATPQLTIAANAITSATITRIAAPAGIAITLTTTTTAGAGQADVRDLEICNNRIFAVQSSILLLQTEDCDILANRLLGLSQTVIDQLREKLVTPQNIDEFQQLVLQAITSASAAFSFHGAGIVLEIATRISIAENTITGLIGISAFIVAEARIQNNQVLAFVGSVILDGFGVHIDGNFIAGLLAGFIQAGIMLDLVCDTNVWIGYFGLLFAPLKTAQGMFGSVVGTALEKGGFASSGSTVLGNAGNFIGNTEATVNSTSFLGVVKVHHEVFITFAEGVAGLPGVIGADVSIVDSSFEFCAVAAISWFTPVQAASLEANLAPQFIVERNLMNIQGVGVACRCVEGVVRGNRIQCGESAIIARCKRGVVQDNIINSTQQQASAKGLIIAGPFRLSNDDLPSFRISGNRLENGPGHGIMLETLFDVIVENNVVAGMAGNGITVASDATLLNTARICGN
ncbi:MAG: carboxypeptidase-like regulatory domain-containing protein, partial [Candidatus Angelobacter sp.]